VGQGHAAALRRVPPAALLLAVVTASPALAGEAPPPSSAELTEAYGRVDGSYYLRFTKSAPRPPAEVELGRELFFDPRLSADGTMSCASCHDPSKGWADGLPRARGLGGRELRRNTLTLLDLRERTLFFWDGRVARLSDQVLFPIQNHEEMGQSLETLLGRLRAVPAYESGFAAAFGGPATADSLARALTAFLQTLNTPADSPFDKGRSDPAAMSPSARRGLVLFAGRAGCLTCHQGALFSDHRFHNLGLKQGSGPEDAGRWRVAPTRGAYGAFRTPGLRNIARTAPYMHDGRFQTLADVVAFYDRGGDGPGDEVYPLRPLGLTAGQRADLVAFLESLSSSLPAFTAPTVPPPAPGPLPVVSAADARAPDPAPARSDRAEPRADAPPAGAAAPSLDAACRDFSLAAFVHALVGPDAASPRAQMIRGSVYEDAVRALVYRSLAAGGDAPCAALAGLTRDFAGVSQAADFFCRDWYHELALVRAAAERGPAFAGVCREALRGSYQDFDAADAAEVCAIVSEDIDRPQELCARLTPRYIDPRLTASCVREYSLLGGSSYDCARGPDAVPSWVEQRCAEYQLYHKARSSKDPESCGRHGLCRALMGDGEGQARLLERRVRDRACGRPS
jgi:cytochrome c peroxidase